MHGCQLELLLLMVGLEVVCYQLKPENCDSVLQTQEDEHRLCNVVNGGQRAIMAEQGFCLARSSAAATSDCPCGFGKWLEWLLFVASPVAATKGTDWERHTRRTATTSLADVHTVVPEHSSPCWLSASVRCAEPGWLQTFMLPHGCGLLMLLLLAGRWLLTRPVMTSTASTCTATMVTWVCQ